jgi:hypothetical protein
MRWTPLIAAALASVVWGCPRSQPAPEAHDHAAGEHAKTPAQLQAPHHDDHENMVPAWPLRGPKRDLAPLMWRDADLEMRSYSLPLNNPPIASPAEARELMRDEDLVLGVLTGQGARAYPWWVVSRYHVINDVLSDTPIFVAQCEVCSGAGAFYPVIDGWLLDFRICGGKGGTFYVCDYQTRSSWTSFAGSAFMGPLAGRRMFRFPAWQTTWAEWRSSHPDTTVVVLPASLRERSHGHGQRPGMEGVPRVLSSTITVEDTRLPENAVIFGLVGTEPLTGRVWPVSTLRTRGGVVHDEYAGEPVLILLQGEHRIGAFVRRLGEGPTLRFEVAGREPLRLRDSQGNTWDEWGRAISGPARGERLIAANGYMAEWFEWVNNHPQSEIAGAE